MHENEIKLITADGDLNSTELVPLVSQPLTPAHIDALAEQVMRQRLEFHTRIQGYPPKEFLV